MSEEDFFLKALMAVILFQVVVCVVMYVEHSVRVACVMKNSTCFVLMLVCNDFVS